MYRIVLLSLLFPTTSAYISENEDEPEVADWSDAKHDGQVRVIDFLVAVDSPLTQYYNFEEQKINSAVVTLMHFVNVYLYPLKLRLAIADIIPMKGYNLTLDDFSAWMRDQKKPVEVDHDVAVLLRYNHEGGIAFHNGVCTPNAIVVSGVSSGDFGFAYPISELVPEATSYNAWLFIHELAHVLGLSHDVQTSCSCSRSLRPGQCLRIKGFDECSAQGLANLLPTHSCLNGKNRTGRSAVPICGNGILEYNEECDCGPERWCDNILCNAAQCRLVLPKSLLYFFITFGIALAAFAVLVSIGEWSTRSVKRFLKRRNTKTDSKTCFVPPSPSLNEVRMRLGIGNDKVSDAQEISESYVVMHPTLWPSTPHRNHVIIA